MALEFGDLTEVIIGAAIDVHRKLGPGFLESVYENALVIELRRRGLDSLLIRFLPCCRSLTCTSRSASLTNLEASSARASNGAIRE